MSPHPTDASISAKHFNPQLSIGCWLVQSAVICLGITAAHAQEVPVQTDGELPTVTVQARKADQTAAGPVKGYVATRSASGTKSDTPLIETAQTISVITRDRMTDQAVQTTEQALRYSAGVLTEATGYDLRYQTLVVRGFYASTYRDGLRTFAAGGFTDWIAEPQGVERVELLKGAASVMYGQAEPGGIVNLISKRPQAEPIRELNLLVGNHDRYQAGIDIGDKMNADGTVLFRVNAMARDSKTQTDFGKDNRLYLAPSLTWRPSGQTALTVLADVTQDRMTPKSWWPDYALTTQKIPVSRDIGEPAIDHYNRDMASVAYLLEHEVNQQLSFRQNLRYSTFKLDYAHVFGNEFLSNQRDVARGLLLTHTTGRALALDNQAQLKFATGTFEHRVLLGLDFQKFSSKEDLYLSPGNDDVPAIDAFNPVYGVPFAIPGTLHGTAKIQQLGFYAQNQVKSGPWHLNVGLRHDEAKTSNLNFDDPDAINVVQSDAKNTYNAGLLYLTEIGIAPFTSFSTSFNPSADLGYDGQPFKPETGHQWELGVKYQPRGGAGMITASVFNLRKQNVSTPDPDHDCCSIQTGEVRSKGFELEGVATLWRQLEVTGSYTYLDSEVTRSNDATELGKPLRQTAKNMASVWLTYHLQGGALQGWDVGSGVRYVGKVASQPSTNYFDASYTLVDALVRYKAGPITVAFNAANLFDKVYVANRASFYGQGRTLQAAVSYRW